MFDKSLDSELTELSESDRRQLPSRTKIAWLMVGISFLIQAVGSGNQYITVLLIQPLKDSLHASTAEVLLATTSTMTICISLGSPLFGLWLQRYSVRSFVVVAFVAVAGGYIGLAYAANIWTVAIVYSGGFAVGLLASYVAANTLVSNWFIKQRGLALGISNAGIAVAGCILPPLATYSIDRFGLRITYLSAAAFVLVLLPMIWKLLVDTPEQLGLQPVGMAANGARAETGSANRESRCALQKLLSNREFWTATIVATLTSGVGTIIVINLMQLAYRAGIARMASSYLVSCEAVGVAIGTIICGKIFDRFSQRATAWWTVALSAAPCVLLIAGSGYYTFVAASILLGIGLGAALLIPSLLAAINFGRSGFSVALGAMNFFIMGFLVIAMPLFGWVDDRYGSYDIALRCCLVVLGCAAIAAQLLPHRSEVVLTANDANV